jgi:hypothetical protein
VCPNEQAVSKDVGATGECPTAGGLWSLGRWAIDKSSLKRGVVRAKMEAENA